MSGVISGFETVGVTLASNPTTIAGTISVSTGNAVTGLAGPVWTLDNNGLVESSKGGGAAFYGQAVVANAAGAIIQGNYQGLYAVQAANIYNAGTLQAIAKFGVALEMVGGGQVTNAVGGVLTGGEVALDFQSNVTIFNAGSILDTGAFLSLIHIFPSTNYCGTIRPSPFCTFVELCVAPRGRSIALFLPPRGRLIEVALVLQDRRYGADGRTRPKCRARYTPASRKPRAKLSQSVLNSGITGENRTRCGMIASPRNRLIQPHTTFTSGADRPTPRGFANGVGNASPRSPAARCGTALHISSPARKLEMINRRGIGVSFAWSGQNSRILYLAPVATNFTAPARHTGQRSSGGGAF